MKNLGAAAAELRKNITIQTHGNGAISLRSTKTSEISSFVKNCNLAETHALKRELNIWHKDTNFEVRKMNRQQEEMYKALLKFSKTKKVIKTTREEKKKDKEEQKIWKNSVRRGPRRNKISVTTRGMTLQELSEIDGILSEDNYLKIDHDDSDSEEDYKPDSSGLNKLAPLTVKNLRQFDRSPNTRETKALPLKPGYKADNKLTMRDASKDYITEENNDVFEHRNNTRLMTSQKEFENSQEDARPKLATDNTAVVGRNCRNSPEVFNTSPLPGLSLKSAYLQKPQPLASKKSIERRKTVGVLRDKRPAHLQRLKSTKFVFLHNSDALKEDDELELKNSSLHEPEDSVESHEHQKDEKDRSNFEQIDIALDKTNKNAITSESANPEIMEPKKDARTYNVLPPIENEAPKNTTKTRKRKRRKMKIKANKVDPSEELNKRSSIQIRPGRTYDVTVYKKDETGNLEEEQVTWDTTVDVAKHFHLASHRDRLQRKKLLDDARDKETQQRERVAAFLEKLTMQQESADKAQLKRRKEAEEARLAFQRRLEVIKRGPPKYGVGDSMNMPSYVRSYVKPSLTRQLGRHRKRSSWSVPSLFTLQLASRTGSSIHNPSNGNAISKSVLFPDSSSSHLVNINIEKYLLNMAEG